MVAIKVVGETIESTPTHPYWVVAGESLEMRPPAKARGTTHEHSTVNGRRVAAQDIQRGDHLLSRDGRLVTVEAKEIADRDTRIFNLMVEHLNNYAVGNTGILVNNM